MRNYLTTDIKSQTERALWEVWNVIDCVPDKLWSRDYYEMILNFRNLIYIPNLNNLDVVTDRFISKNEIKSYYDSVKK